MKELDITKEDPCDGCIVLPMCNEICILKKIYAKYHYLIKHRDFIKVTHVKSKTGHHCISIILNGSTHTEVDIMDSFL